MSYSLQPLVQQWLASNERFQLPRSSTAVLQSIRDGSLPFRILTAHIPPSAVSGGSGPPPMPAPITERWQFIAAALVDCGFELTPYGLKRILLGDSDSIDLLMTGLFALHHGGHQGSSAAAPLSVPFQPEPECLYPKLFHSILVNAKQENFVERVRILTDGCCDGTTSEEDRQLLQLQALGTHSRRLVEFGLAEEFFGTAMSILLRASPSRPSVCNAVSALIKNFVSGATGVGPEVSYASLMARTDRRQQQTKLREGNPHFAKQVGVPKLLGSIASRSDVSLGSITTTSMSGDPIVAIGTLLGQHDILPELREFIVSFLYTIAVTISPQEQNQPAKKDKRSPQSTLIVEPVAGGKLTRLMSLLFPVGKYSHSQCMSHYRYFFSKCCELAASPTTVFCEAPGSATQSMGETGGSQGTLGRSTASNDPAKNAVHQARQEETMRRELYEAGIWIVQRSVAMLEGRDPDDQPLYAEPFNPNGRFEANYHEEATRVEHEDDVQLQTGRSHMDDISDTPRSMQSGAGVSPKSRQQVDTDDDDEALKQYRRTLELRKEMQQSHARETRERLVCAEALSVILRVWTQVPETLRSYPSNEGPLIDVLEFLRSSRGKELCTSSLGLLGEVAGAAAVSPSLLMYVISLAVFLKQNHEARRLLLQCVTECIMRSTKGDGDASFFGPITVAVGSEVTQPLSRNGSFSSLTSSRTGVPAGRVTSLAAEVLEMLSTLCASLGALGEMEGESLMACGHLLVRELLTEEENAPPPPPPPAMVMGSVAVPPPAEPAKKGKLPNTKPAATSARGENGKNRRTTTSAPPGLGSDANSDLASESSVSLNNSMSRSGAVTLISQFFDLLQSVIDKDVYSHKWCIQSINPIAQFCYSSPTRPSLQFAHTKSKNDFLHLISSFANELLSMAEEHRYPDLILQAIGMMFIELTDARRLIAETIHMFFQTVVRRDPSTLTSAQQHDTEVFIKRMRKLCELVSMPTTRVKVKVLDDEEAARLAAIRRAEEAERKRVAEEAAELARLEALERGYNPADYIDENGKKKREPLYKPPGKGLRPGDWGGGSIFEWKRTTQWMKRTVIEEILDKCVVIIVDRDYRRKVDPKARPVRDDGDEEGGMPSSFWSGWQRGVKYEDIVAQRQQNEAMEAARREQLRLIRVAEVKAKLAQAHETVAASAAALLAVQQGTTPAVEFAMPIGIDKRILVHLEEQQNLVFEEEGEERRVIANLYLKLLVQLYHVHRENVKAIVASSAQEQQAQSDARRRREEELRNAQKARIAKYWEEKEAMEAERQRRAAEEQTVQERLDEQKRQRHLDEQKRRLMTWRLQQQYEAGGCDEKQRKMAMGDVSTSSSMLSNASPKKKSQNASGARLHPIEKPTKGPPKDIGEMEGGEGA